LPPQEISILVKEYTDREIIECLRNRQSYVVLYLSDQYLPMIKNMVIHLGGSSEDAKDIFQEGLMIILEKIDSREFALTCKFKTFLYCICENLWKSVLIKRQSAVNYFQRRTEVEEDADFSEQVDDDMCREIFMKSFKKLDKSGRKILKLYWKGYSPQEIAEKLNYSYGYVRKKKSESQAELIEKVKSHPEYRKIIESDEMVKRVIY
jgi:RNA polymerase sigma factor (sigma-70 family)